MHYKLAFYKLAFCASQAHAYELYIVSDLKHNLEIIIIIIQPNWAQYRNIGFDNYAPYAKDYNMALKKVLGINYKEN